MNLFDSQNLVEEAGTAYEQGQPILTDEEFDLLADNGLNQDIQGFREKVEHLIPMGSLRKYTSGTDLARWWYSNGFKILVVMPKYDGLSISKSYRWGTLIGSASRGDGIVGNSIIDNLRHTRACLHLPSAVLPARMEFRAEAIIPKHYASEYDTNLRNVASGRLMAKDPDAALTKINTIFFDAFDLDLPRQPSWEEKKAWLEELPNHQLARFIEMEPEDGESLYQRLEKLYDHWKESLEYRIDGLVVMGLHDPKAPLPEPSLDPKWKIAVKFKQAGIPATVRRIDWQLGKYGKLTPVVVVDPVQIDGTTVTKVSASNYSLLTAAGLGIGAVGSLVKAGDIVPHFSAVLTPSRKGLELPFCPECGSQSQLDGRGVDAICPNPHCEGKELVILQKLIGDLFEIDFVSDTTIRRLVEAGFDSLEKLYAATVNEIAGLPGFGVKSATHLVNSLHSVSLTEAKVIKAAGLKGIGERKGIMLLSHYGTLDRMLAEVRERGLDNIEGFGGIQSELIAANLEKIERTRDRFLTLGIRITPQPQKEDKPMQERNICATGAAPGMPRTQFEALVAQHGFRLQDKVNKDTAILVCADPSGSSSKLKKARELGTEVLSYEQFLEKLN